MNGSANKLSTASPWAILYVFIYSPQPCKHSPPPKKTQLLFTVMAIIMSFPAPVKYTSDWRDRHLHHGAWHIKAGAWAAFTVLPFFFANPLVNAYSWLARIASPLFLGLQMLIIIDMANSWNEEWVRQGEEDVRYLYALLACSLGAYALSFTASGVAYNWFAPSNAAQDCSLNISLITIGLVVVVALTAVTLHPRIKESNPSASIFVASVTALYCSYLGFAALQSEPRDYACNSLGQKISAASGTTLAAGMLITLVSTVWAAFRAGSNTSTFATGAGEWSVGLEGRESLLGGVGGVGGGDEEMMTSAGLDGVSTTTDTVIPPQAVGSMHRTPGHSTASNNNGTAAISEFIPVAYSYLQFYLVFALASMYLAMLMTGWGTGSEQKDQIDVGWTSVWVKTVSQWVAGGLYCWTLVAPVLFPDRVFA